MMKKKPLRTIIALGVTSLLLFGTAAGPAWADDEQTLRQKAATMDQAAPSSKQETARAQALAAEFKVPESRVTDLRNKKMGWGEISTSLAMAQHLATSSKTPMTTEEALIKIEQLRSEKMGWGRIAKELGFKLGPVVSDVERSEKAMKSADREAGERPEQKAKAERAEKGERAEKAERAERTERAERPARPERSGR